MTEVRSLSFRGAIERDAEALLAESCARARVVMEPPIPIEDIVEKHLKLGIEFDDTAPAVRRAALRRFGRSRHPRRDLLRRAPDRHRREPRPGGEPGDGGPLSVHAGARGRRALASASAPVRSRTRRSAPFSGRPRLPSSVRSSKAKGADRMAGGFLRVVPADAESNGDGRMARAFRRTGKRRSSEAPEPHCHAGC